ncbi:hypothetical protein LARI1_G004723, partial [Lachnellula arida]
KTQPGIQNFTSETPQFFPALSSSRTKVSYGPFSVPPSSTNNGMIDYQLGPVKIACTDCTITYMRAGLEYPNGSYANANTSLELHHTVLVNEGNVDTACGYQGERIFASGNERSEVDLCINGTNQAGYYVAANDTIYFIAELMNTSEDTQTAVVTITFEYIPHLPPGFNKVTPVWLDIAGCDSDSEVPVKNDAVFEYTSVPWMANTTGRVVAAIGHIHDGGTHIQISNNNSTLCDCTATYGSSPGYIDAAGGMVMNMTGMSAVEMGNVGKHISAIKECDGGQIALGDNVTVTASYNLTEYVPMMYTNGSLAPMMGIGLVYVAQNETFTASATPTTTAATVASGVLSSSSNAAAATHVAGGKVWVVGVVGGMAVLAFA